MIFPIPGKKGGKKGMKVERKEEWKERKQTDGSLEEYGFLKILFNYFYFLRYFIYLILERGEGREKEGERNINVWLPLVGPVLGTWPAAQACALTGKRA